MLRISVPGGGHGDEMFSLRKATDKKKGIADGVWDVEGALHSHSHGLFYGSVYQGIDADFIHSHFSGTKQNKTKNHFLLLKYK